MTLLDSPHIHRLTGDVIAAGHGTAAQQGDPAAAAGWRALEKMICLVVLFLLGSREIFKGGLTFGACAALLLCPIWIGVLRRYRHAGLLFACTALTLVNGLVLAAFAGHEHRYASFSSVLDDSTLWIGTLAAVGVVLWSRTVASLSSIGLAYGLGLLVHNLAHPDLLAPTNPWKFVYSFPVAIVALGIASRHRSRVASLLVLLALAAISAVLDSRSLFGSLLFAAVLLGWQLRPRISVKPLAWGWTLVLVCGLGAAIYNLMTALMLEGALGTEIQHRSQQQVQAAGSLLLGGRPELAATLALMRHDPAGFGVGVAPNIYDVMAAKSGMIEINYNPNFNGYVDRYMFGGHVELHSTAGDLWALFGIGGLLTGCAVMLVAVRGLSHSMSARAGNGLLAFVVCQTLWDLPFSPLYSSIPTLILTLGLGLTVNRGHIPTGHDRNHTQDAPGR